MTTDDLPMTSARPFLLKGLYEWVLSNGYTPHVLVDATVPGVQVPRHAVNDGKIVLNVSETAVQNLQMDETGLRFNARFGTIAMAVVVPIDAVEAIFARETQVGLALPSDESMGISPKSAVSQPETSLEPAQKDRPAPKGNRDHLRVVK